METVKNVSSGKSVENIEKHFLETWITNENENAIVKRNNLFENGFKIPKKRIANDTKLRVITLPI